MEKILLKFESKEDLNSMIEFFRNMITGASDGLDIDGEWVIEEDNESFFPAFTLVNVRRKNEQIEGSN